MKIKHISTPKNCTGCGLCANVCSQDAIRMEWSKEGFLVPQVDTVKCVNCGLCVKQCIALEEKSGYSDDINSVIAYGGWNKDTKIHINSSSGGIFTALAENVIQQGGVVFGVVWRDKVTAVFDKAETEGELSKMRGSKYTPAVPGYVYRDVKTELQTRRQVLFSGTPCQVRALKKYLRKPYDNLLTVDIVCHGAPSHLILEKYIAEDEARSGKSIDHISFRDKPEGWQRFHVTRHYTNGTTASCPLDQDAYMRLFLCDKALNKVCYNCPYAHIPRQGDITLGDYWGVQNHHPDWPLDKGISAILANSDKGKSTLESIKGQLDLRNEPFKLIYKGQDIVYVRPSKQIPKDRKLVLEKLREWALQEVKEKIINTEQFGPFRLRTNMLPYKLLTFSLRAAGYIKRKILQK